MMVHQEGHNSLGQDLIVVCLMGGQQQPSQECCQHLFTRVLISSSIQNTPKHDISRCICNNDNKAKTYSLKLIVE